MLDEASLAAIRHIRELRGEIEFDTTGVPVAVDLAGNRASAEGLDVGQLAALTTLTKLRLASGKISDADVPQLLQLVNLRELAVRNSQLGDSGFRQLAALPHLKTLDVQRSIRLTDDALQSLGDFPQLTDLVLVENLFTNQGLASVARATRLQSLDLRGCSQIDAAGLEQLKPLGELSTLKLRGAFLDASCLRLLSAFPKLASLTIEDAPLGDDDLAELSALPLEDLVLERCFNITDEGLRHFQALPKLRASLCATSPSSVPAWLTWPNCRNCATLRLRQTGIRDESLPLLQKLPHLERLDLVQALITDEGLAVIGELKTLAQLDLEANQLSDAGVAHLAGLENLRTLGLAGNEGVTDQSFQALGVAAHAGVPGLVRHRRHRAGADGVESGSAELPDCQVTIPSRERHAQGPQQPSCGLLANRGSRGAWCQSACVSSFWKIDGHACAISFSRSVSGPVIGCSVFPASIALSNRSRNDGGIAATTPGWDSREPHGHVDFDRFLDGPVPPFASPFDVRRPAAARHGLDRQHSHLLFPSQFDDRLAHAVPQVLDKIDREHDGIEAEALHHSQGGFGGVGREAQVLDLALFLGLDQRLDGPVRTEGLIHLVLPTQMMQLVQIEVVGLEQLERLFQFFARPALSRFLVLQARK